MATKKKQYTNPFMKVQTPVSDIAAESLLREGIVFHQQGQYEKAQEIYLKVLEVNSSNSDALHLMGVIAHQRGNYQVAVELIAKAIQINKKIASYYSNIGLALHELKRFEAAIENYDIAIKLELKYAEAFYNRGNALRELKQLESAVASYDEAIYIKPNYTKAYFNKGNALEELLQLEAALKCYDKAIGLKPDYAEAYSYRGNVLQKLKQLDAAVIDHDMAIALMPEDAFAYLSKGSALKALGKRDESLACFKKSIALNPNSDEAFYYLGSTLALYGQYEEASRYLIKSIKLRPDFHEALLALGIVQMNQCKFELAVGSFDKVLSIQPNISEVYFHRANALCELRRFNESLSNYDIAIELQKDYVQAYCNRGYVLLNYLYLPDIAIQFFESALELQPDLAEALVNKGQALFLINELDKSKEYFLKALKLCADHPYLIGKCTRHLMMLCDWQYLTEGLLICEDVLKKQMPASTPLEIFNFFDSPESHLLTVKLFNQYKFPLDPSLGEISKREPTGRVRIGYYSADLYYHPVSIWLAEQLENHDKSKVELYAFCLKSVQDPMRDRLEAAFDHWIDVQSMSDLEITKLSRELGIDIAIDLNGHTADGRTGIFAARAAPIQLNHLGFPGSMGAEYIDYMIGHTPSADEDLQELARSRQFITEKIAYVPSVFTYDRQRQLSDEPLTRSQFGLPETEFVFTCQNGCQKLMPEVFDIWMEILKAVPGSVLWLLKPNETAVKNLIKEAQARGVEEERLVFTAREVVPIEQEKARIGKYLASYKLADLFLDTWPYNAGTTAIDALWAGLPVLTKEGKAQVAKMAAGALRGIEVPELITRTPQDYQELAIELAHSPEKLRQLKDKVQRNKLTTALFDPVANTRHIESAYLEMYRRYQESIEPEDFLFDPKRTKPLADTLVAF